jgi:PIN domain nuclease of toxin-antitoxin system
MADVVLDSSAILARVLGEPGGEAVAAVVDGARVSAVNLAEVAQRLIDLGVDDAGVVETVRALPCEVVAFDDSLALRTSLLRRSTRHKGLSLGDRACLALAEREGWPVLTADRAWAELDLGIEVVLIR